MRYRSHKRMMRKRGKWIAGAVILCLLFLVFFLIAVLCKVRTVEVTGNNHYTEDEIRELVMNDRYSGNSLYLYGKYNYFHTEDIPFVDKIEVNLVSADTVKIRVYEKSLIGYVEYLGTNLYFDKDGVVVESTSRIREDVPRIFGLNFKTLTLYQKLDVEDDEIFNKILTVTQHLKKNQLNPDKIEFKRNLDLVLHFEQVRVELGEGEHLEEKLGRLPQFLPELYGKSGVLDMAGYSEDSSMVSFKQDK